MRVSPITENKVIMMVMSIREKPRFDRPDFAPNGRRGVLYFIKGSIDDLRARFNPANWVVLYDRNRSLDCTRPRR
jgi:hypothetical protein